MADNQKYYYMRLKDNFYDSDELKIIEAMPDGYLYSNILLKLYLKSLKYNGRLMFNERIPYNPTVLATITRHQVGTVERALEIFQDLDLIEVLDNGAIYMLDIQNLIGKSSTEADRKREYRERINAEKAFLIEERQMSGQMSGQKHPEIEIDIDIEKNIEIDTICAFDNAPIENPAPTENKISKAEINDFFETIWKLYPNKKGKGQISDSKKKALYKIGLEEMTRAIERYKADLDKVEWRKPQNGSTFFNSGYVDYLDANYEPTKARLQPKKNNSFNNFPQRQYDMDAYERMLLNAQNQRPTAGTDENIRARAEKLQQELGGKA